MLLTRIFRANRPPLPAGGNSAVQRNVISPGGVDPQTAGARDTVHRWRFRHILSVRRRLGRMIRHKGALTGRFGRFLFFIVLVLTSAIAMRFGTLLTRSKVFHPNWPAKNAAARGARLSGD